jgi:hypothetical protein
LIAIRCNFQKLFLGAVHQRDTALLRSDEDDKAAPWRQWSVNESALSAVLDTILAGVSYLLYVAGPLILMHIAN